MYRHLLCSLFKQKRGYRITFCLPVVYSKQAIIIWNSNNNNNNDDNDNDNDNDDDNDNNNFI